MIRGERKICLTKWKDNKSVLMISNAFGETLVGSVSRWDKDERGKIDVTYLKVEFQKKWEGSIKLIKCMNDVIDRF